MEEVATTVLHNVGNVLNSVNVSASVVADKVRNSKTANLARAAEMLREHGANLAGFLANDPRGSKLPGYFATLAGSLAVEQNEILAELATLCANIEHIKEIVAMQQAYARVAGLRESLNATDLIEDALRLNAGAVERHHVRVVREVLADPAPDGGQTQNLANPRQSHPQCQIRLGRPLSRRPADDPAGRAGGKRDGENVRH